MNWHVLYFGKVTREEVHEAIQDPTWQKLRKEMRGRTLEEKYDMLWGYYYGVSQSIRNAYLKGKYARLPGNSFSHDMRMLEVRCTNYVTALARGGLITVSDYR